MSKSSSSSPSKTTVGPSSGPPIAAHTKSHHNRQQQRHFIYQNRHHNNQTSPSLVGHHQEPKQSEKTKRLKCVFVGDDAIGKTSLIVSYTTNGYPTEYIPTAFDTYSVLVTIDNKPCQLQLCDTAGQDDFDSIRPLCYNHTDVFLVSFSVVSPRSFRNIRQKWLPEIRRTITGGSSGSNKSSSRSMPPFILIGTQCDLRHDVKVLIELDSIGEQPISSDYAKNMAKKLGAICYIECSALTQKNLKEVFDSAILAGLEYQKNQQRQQHQYRHHHECNKHKPYVNIESSKLKQPLNCPSDSNSSNNLNMESSQIYQDYCQLHRHFLPITPPKLAQISDAKLVGWRKSLTKLSAQEALKSEAEAVASSRDDDTAGKDQTYEYYPHHHSPTTSSHQAITKLSTFSPLPSPLASPKFPPKITSKNSKIKQTSSGKTNPKTHIKSTTKSSKKILQVQNSLLLFSDPDNLETITPNDSFNDVNTQTRRDFDFDSKLTNCHNHISRSPSCIQRTHNPQQKNVCNNSKPLQNSSSLLQQQKTSNSFSKSSSGYHPSPPLSLMLASSSSQYNSDYNGFIKHNQHQIYNSPYAMSSCYQTPYGTTVAVVPAKITSEALVPFRSPELVYQPSPLPRCPPLTPVIHNRSIFQFHNTRSSLKNSALQTPNYAKPHQQLQQQPCISRKTNLATTLRSSSFFFLPSNKLKMKQQEHEQWNKQKQTKKLSKSNSTASSGSSSSSSSASSIHSSNELFHRSSNNNHTNKSMLDLFHQMMSTSVTELRNRKSSMFRKLASSLSSSSSSSSSGSSHTSPSCAGSKEKQRLKKNEKLKDLYYYDSYDYEEIDLDRRGKCCNNSSLWSCCFPSF